MTPTQLDQRTIPRHKAALKRNELSLPMAATIDGGILQHHHTHLDYGCGRGDDVRFLQAMGFRSRGYDPYYFPRIKKAADIVTLIYVLSTIETLMVRCEALISAYHLTRKTLVVSAITPAIDQSCGYCLQRWRNYQVGYVREVLLPHGTQTIEDTLGVPARYVTHNTYTVSHNSKALSLIIHPRFFPCKAVCTPPFGGGYFNYLKPPNLVRSDLN